MPHLEADDIITAIHFFHNLNFAFAFSDTQRQGGKERALVGRQGKRGNVGVEGVSVCRRRRDN